jgi:tellurite resistance protein
MTEAPPRLRPQRYPPPEFPPRRPALFARMPPAVFPPVLGLLGTVLALRTSGAAPEIADLAAGLVVALWLFLAVAYGSKLARRASVLAEDLRVLPGRSGLSAATMGGMAAAAVLAPHAPGLAGGLLLAALAAHVVVLGLVARQILTGPPEGRSVTPVWNMVFVSWIVGGIAAVALGWRSMAEVLLWLSVPPGLAIWGASLVQFARRVPPAPLRPLLAIHLAPVSLIATVAFLQGHSVLGQGMLTLAALLAVVLVAGLPWLTAAGFSALWGAFTFPLASFAGALLVQGWRLPGLAATVLALLSIPWIAWRIFRLWPPGKLAAATNAAEA